MIVLATVCKWPEDYAEQVACVVSSREDADLFITAFPPEEGWKYVVREYELLSHDELLQRSFEPLYGMSTENALEGMNGYYVNSEEDLVAVRTTQRAARFTRKGVA